MQKHQIIGLIKIARRKYIGPKISILLLYYVILILPTVQYSEFSLLIFSFVNSFSVDNLQILLLPLFLLNSILLHRMLPSIIHNQIHSSLECISFMILKWGISKVSWWEHWSEIWKKNHKLHLILIKNMLLLQLCLNLIFNG